MTSFSESSLPLGLVYYSVYCCHNCFKMYLINKQSHPEIACSNLILLWLFSHSPRCSSGGKIPGITSPKLSVLTKAIGFQVTLRLATTLSKTKSFPNSKYTLFVSPAFMLRGLSCVLCHLILCHRRCHTFYSREYLNKLPRLI